MGAMTGGTATAPGATSTGPSAGPATTPTATPAASPATGSAPPPETWRLAWERSTTVPLALAAFAFLAAYAIPIAWPDVDRQVARACTVTMQVAWLTLFVDFEIRFLLARRKFAFLTRNLLDLAVLIAPAFYALRMLKLVALLSIIDRAGVRTLRGRVMTYAVAVTLLVFFVGSLALTQVERTAPGTEIKNLGDAAWFSIATMTTVGYGDMLPVTVGGRIIAVVLMITGLAMLGTVTATLASVLTSKVAAGSGSRDATRADVEALSAQLTELRTFLRDPTAGEPLHEEPQERTRSRLADLAVESVDRVESRLPHRRTPPWIESHTKRAIAALLGSAAAIVFGLSGLAVVAAGGRGTQPTQEQIDNTIAGMPSALAFYLLGAALVAGAAIWVASIAFRRDDGPRWTSMLAAVIVMIAYGTTTMVLLDQVSSTALVSSLSISFPFAAGVVAAMAYAQSRPAEPAASDAPDGPDAADGPDGSTPAFTPVPVTTTPKAAEPTA